MVDHRHAHGHDHAHETAARGPFPGPGHDHAVCAASILDHADAVCAARGARLTPIRRGVLTALAAEHRPLGAYDLIDRLAEGGKRPAPITIYRALDFLLEQGLAHRIESRNAFVACTQTHHRGDLTVFLICDSCGSVGEMPSATVRMTLMAAARAAGFAPTTTVLEIGGTCAHCAAA
jgi:Fur family transcriptional regulator, zinc uptake regulator